MKILFAVASFLVLTVCASANDSAVETAVGGLKLRKEHSVLMKKERLYISRKTVKVEYEFLNTSNDPVASEVAFPIPPIKYVVDDPGGKRDFTNFKAWIDDVPVSVKKEVRAFVKDRDVTEDLRKAKLSIETFGNYDVNESTNPFESLKPEVRAKLVKIGALKAKDYWPQWEVHIKFHWHQEFPPGAIVRIKHEYKPVAGFGGADVKDFKKYFKDTCIDQKTFAELKKREQDKYFDIHWISYILTTANTWKTPLEDFELIVEGKKGDLISFCWDGPVEKVGPEKFRAQIKDFVPKKDLKVYFYSKYPI
ncbi:MAG: hypothetical protein CXR30_19390 [Geobacter sp.]|nr:MAG: hypothetical protein CXR30_19390 [Geobacter sp.]